MNIYYLDHDPAMAARYHTDRHVSKMILETLQILAHAHYFWDGHKSELLLKHEPPMRLSHRRFPSVSWVSASSKHYEWLYGLGEALLGEYRARFMKPNVLDVTLRQFKKMPKNMDANLYVRAAGFLPPPLDIPLEFHKSDHVESYRDYYFTEKQHLAEWSPPATKPPWWKRRELERGFNSTHQTGAQP